MKTNMISIWMCTLALTACEASKESVVNQQKADWGATVFSGNPANAGRPDERGESCNPGNGIA